MPRVQAARAVGDEVFEHLPAIARRRGLDLALMMAALTAMPVTWAAPEVYEPAEVEARERLGPRDIDDWPTAALALVLGRTRSVSVWTQDRDFEWSGLATLTTGELLDILEGRR